MAGKSEIRLKRAYETPSSDDGRRILVERLWPRGLTKEKAKIDLWMKEIAPSTELRQWFGHDPAKWEGFKKRYAGELAKNEPAVARLEAECSKTGIVTFIYAAKDIERNSALVLRDFIAKRGKR